MSSKNKVLVTTSGELRQNIHTDTEQNLDLIPVTVEDFTTDEIFPGEQTVPNKIIEN